MKQSQRQETFRDIRKKGKDIKTKVVLTFEESVGPKKSKAYIPKIVVFTRQVLCTGCTGVGFDESPVMDCRVCRGKGRVAREVTLEVRIPRGVEDKAVLEVDGEGDEGLLGHRDGSLLLEIKVQT